MEIITRMCRYMQEEILKNNMESLSEVLVDLVRGGKPVDWKGRKENSLKLSDIYSYLASYDGLDFDVPLVPQSYFENKALRVRFCGSDLWFKVFENGEKKLHKANFCKVRLCPICSWRRSLKIFSQVSNVMNRVSSDFSYRYIFLTLTSRNVSGENLSPELDNYFKAFNLLTKRKEFKAMSKGWFRSLEVTYNVDSDTYHPHFHMIIAVNKSYFACNGGNYLTHADYVRLWRECLGIDYDPSVRVKVVKGNESKLSDGSSTVNYSKAVAEVSKYSVKSNDYILSPPEGYENIEEVRELYNIKSVESVYYFDLALRNRRLAAFGGKFKEIHKLLNLDDVVDGDLVNTDSDDIRSDLAYIMKHFGWRIGASNYYYIPDDD